MNLALTFTSGENYQAYTPLKVPPYLLHFQKLAENT
jgi:hypothetical protein